MGPNWVPSNPSSTPASRPTTTPTSKPGGDKPPADKLQTGIISTCNKYAKAPDKATCYNLAQSAGIDPSQLYAWNSILGPGGADCGTKLWAGYYYCVGISGGRGGNEKPTVTSTVKPPLAGPGTISSSASKPSKTQPGSIVENCKKFDQVKGKEGCWTFAERNKIKLEQLYAWNKVLGANGENCEAQMWLGYFYCVGV